MKTATERVHRFIIDYEKRHGTMPYQNEIAAAMGWQSRGSVVRALGKLVDAGLIRRRGSRFALPPQVHICERCNAELEEEMIREEEREANSQFGVGA